MRLSGGGGEDVDHVDAGVAQDVGGDDVVLGRQGGRHARALPLRKLTFGDGADTHPHKPWPRCRTSQLEVTLRRLEIDWRCISNVLADPRSCQRMEAEFGEKRVWRKEAKDK
eukprot:4806925-Pleurochrysis_carterae.AAC.1